MIQKSERGQADARSAPYDWPSETGSWDELLGRLRVRAAAIMAAYEIPAHEAEDLMQDALLALVARRAEVRSPESYLVGILRHGCAAHIRQRYKERRVLQVDPGALAALAGAAASGHGTADDRLDLVTLLDTLPTRQFCVLLLRLLGLHLGGDMPLLQRLPLRRFGDHSSSQTPVSQKHGRANRPQQEWTLRPAPSVKWAAA
jgi:hypothetical protein